MTTTSPDSIRAVDMRPGHEFDFLRGQWVIRHRRLKLRLQDCTTWEDFGGTLQAWSLLGGLGNVDDNWLAQPSGAYRAVTMRTFDPVTGQWAIWWLDGRAPGQLDTPVRGSFVDGVGEFFADDQLDGRAIRVRFRWSDISATGARWEQAFSPDAGATWEINWVMDMRRTDEPAA
ncbi:DUF1579 domain-containing protein [Roseateles aquatilis]|uniref:DUF1579 domain-containing protein n=1 Tax=Roseateles aquatilis TaxID=431061 RepID=A0A246J4R6_9BURK|nr:DUF1579 domain-containing protein [Roseateles aquatilis]OWQ87569.1 DUF1579 domain-containing protein [Roseateles aquatilis]